MVEHNALERFVMGLEKALAWPLATARKGAGTRPGRWVARLALWYKTRVWDRFARDAQGKTTAKRAGFTLLGTLVALWLLPGFIGSAVQGALMATTWQGEETVYLIDSQEIDPDGDVHAIRGCRSLPCTESNSLYFRVRPDLAHTLYSLLAQGDFFYPDLTASVVTPGLNRCTVTSYGVRMRVLRGWGYYPDLLNATCTPLSEETALPSNG